MTIMKQILERFKQANLLTKIGFILGLPFLAVLYIARSPILFGMWFLSCLSDVFEGEEGGY